MVTAEYTFVDFLAGCWLTKIHGFDSVQEKTDDRSSKWKMTCFLICKMKQDRETVKMSTNVNTCVKLLPFQISSLHQDRNLHLQQHTVSQLRDWADFITSQKQQQNQKIF